MSLLQDLANGKELTLSNGSKLSFQYATDSNVMKLILGGNSVDLSDVDMGKIVQIEQILRLIKQLESKV